MSLPPEFPPRPPTVKELKKNLSALKKAVLKTPLDLDARLRIARTYRLLDKPDDAIDHYRSVAKYLANAGHPMLAMAVAKELLQVNPEHQETLMLLARLYARTPGANPGGRVAVKAGVPHEDAAAAGLLREWPKTHTGVWRAIQPDEAGELMRMVNLSQVPGQPAAAGTFAALLQGVVPQGPALMNQPLPDVASRMAEEPPAEAEEHLALDEADVVEESHVEGELDEPRTDANAEAVHELDEADVHESEPLSAERHAVDAEQVLAEDHEIHEADEVGAQPAEEVPTDPGEAGAPQALADEDIQAIPDDSGESPVPPLPDVPEQPLPALPEIPLFAALPPQDFVELSKAFTHKTATAGQVLWKEGDDAFFLVVLAAGEAVTFKGPDLQRVELARLGPGDVAGVFALVADRRRQASLQAVTDMAYFELHRGVVERLAREHEALADGLKQFFRDRVLQSALAMLPVFKEMDAATRAEVSTRFRSKRYQDGDELFYEGAEVTGLWVVLEGAVAVGQETPDGIFEARHTLPAGHFVGALGSAEEHTELGAQAKGVTLTANLNHKGFMELVALHPALKDLGPALSVAGMLLTPHILGGSAQLPADLSPAFLRGGKGAS